MSKVECPLRTEGSYFSPNGVLLCVCVYDRIQRPRHFLLLTYCAAGWFGLNCHHGFVHYVLSHEASPASLTTLFTVSRHSAGKAATNPGVSLPDKAREGQTLYSKRAGLGTRMERRFQMWPISPWREGEDTVEICVIPVSIEVGGGEPK